MLRQPLCVITYRLSGDIMFSSTENSNAAGSAQADGKQIQKIGRKNATNGQRNLMKDRLGAWVIGDVEHIGLPVPRSQNVDEKGNGKW